MGHYVYKYMLNGEIIYIGKNDSDLFSRIIQHGKIGDSIRKDAWNDINNADVYYISTKDKIQNHEVEAELIYRYKPKYNRITRLYSSLSDYKEPKWKPLLKKNIDYYIQNLGRIRKWRLTVSILASNKKMFYWIKHLLFCRKYQKYIYDYNNNQIIIKFSQNLDVFNLYGNVLTKKLNYGFTNPGNMHIIDDNYMSTYDAKFFLSDEFEKELLFDCYCIKQQLEYAIKLGIVTNNIIIQKVNALFEDYHVTDNNIKNFYK